MAHTTQIKGTAPVIMTVENGKLFSNAPFGCVVFGKENKEIARVNTPVLDYPIDAKGPYSFKELDKPL